MTHQDQIVYQLNVLCRQDDAVNAFVGYIPRLRLYTQAKTKDRLQKALQATATQFILACIENGTLETVLHETGAESGRTTSVEEIQQSFTTKDREFVAVMGYEECAEQVEITVPMARAAVAVG